MPPRESQDEKDISVARDTSYNYVKPDEAAVRSAMLREDDSPAITAIHLAWNCGLMRNEIRLLTWNQVNFDRRQIELPDRAVPMPDETYTYLQGLYSQYQHFSDYVLVSRRGKAPLTEHNVSMLVRRALNDVGQTDVKLSDLRSHYIIRLLEENNWEYTSSLVGVDQRTLREHYLRYIEKPNLRYARPPMDDDLKNSVYQYISEERDSQSSLALRFICKMGILPTDLPHLTWSMVEFEKGEIHHGDRVIPLTSDTSDLLKDLKRTNAKHDPHIFLRDNTKKPMDYPYLQRIIYKGLVGSGILGVNLKQLYVDYWADESQRKDSADSAPAFITEKVRLQRLSRDLESYLEQNGFIDIKTAKQTLQISGQEASALLASCRQEGLIDKVGNRYCLKGNVVAREKQHEVILKYVAENQPVTSRELTELLGLVERRQIYSVIKPLLASGELIRSSVNRYCLGAQVSDNSDGDR